jgi:hypothetical protein
MQNDFVASLSDDSMRATAGVSLDLFGKIYGRYGGAGTPLSQR